MLYTLTAQMSGQRAEGWHSSQQLPSVSIDAHSPREAVAKLIDLVGPCGDRGGLTIRHGRALSVGVTWDGGDGYASIMARWAPGAIQPQLTTI